MGLLKRAQISVELMFVLVVFLSVVLVFFVLYISTSNTMLDWIRYVHAKNTADTLASHINDVAMGGPANAYIYANIDRKDYNISIESGAVRVDYNGIVAYSHIFVNDTDVILNFKGTELLVRKSGGKIYVEDVQKKIRW
ncbi:MAG: hypothetical protein ACP5KJ_03300 [Candidatus Micrarchaeia archaeon]